MAGYYWCNFSLHSGSLPPNAVRGGTDSDGSPIYVGRTHYNGDLLPAKVIPCKNYAAVSWDGREISIQNCEVLCENNFQWVDASNGTVPPGAIPAGRTSCGETLYVARAYHENSQTVGKLHPSHGSCYIPHGGREHAHCFYQVLVARGQGCGTRGCMQSCCTNVNTGGNNGGYHPRCPPPYSPPSNPGNYPPSYPGNYPPSYPGHSSPSFPGSFPPGTCQPGHNPISRPPVSMPIPGGGCCSCSGPCMRNCSPKKDLGFYVPD